jgi:transposase
VNIAEPIVLFPEEQTIIDRWSCGRSFPVRLVQRAKVIQMAAKGTFGHIIASTLGISRPTVQLWRQRFLSLRCAGLEKDAPRPGRIPGISTRKIKAVIEATLHTTPANATHWSTRTMAQSQGLSQATIRRIWKRHNLKPHLTKTFKLSRDKHFVEKLCDVVGLSSGF